MRREINLSQEDLQEMANALYSYIQTVLVPSYLSYEKEKKLEKILEMATQGKIYIEEGK